MKSAANQRFFLVTKLTYFHLQILFRKIIVFINNLESAKHCAITESSRVKKAGDFFVI